MDPGLWRDAQADQEDACPEQEAGETDPHGETAVSGAAQCRERQRPSQRAVKPSSQQSDEGNEGGGCAEQKARDNHHKTDAGQRLATPLLATKVVLLAAGVQV